MAWSVSPHNNIFHKPFPCWLASLHWPELGCIGHYLWCSKKMGVWHSPWTLQKWNFPPSRLCMSAWDSHFGAFVTLRASGLIWFLCLATLQFSVLLVQPLPTECGQQIVPQIKGFNILFSAWLSQHCNQFEEVCFPLAVLHISMLKSTFPVWLHLFKMADRFVNNCFYLLVLWSRLTYYVLSLPLSSL